MPLNKRLMSVEDLYQFCLKNNFNHFDYKESNYEISVQMPGNCLFEKEETDKHKDGLRPFTAKAYHDHINLNRSKIETDAFKENTKSAPFRPILANIVKDEETGELDYGSHDFTIETNEDGEEIVVYQEQPVGVIGTDYSIEYDEKAEVNRAILHGYLYEEYCADAVSILDRRGSTDCSIELSIRSFSFDAKDKVLVLDDYYIEGLTLLGAKYAPGMQGSNVVLDNFSTKNNSMFSHLETNEKLIETLDKLNTTLSNFNIDDKSKEGGQDMDKKFEELLEKYGKSKEDVDFDYSEMTEEELEAKFEELFGEDTSSDDGASADDGEDPEVTEPEGGEGDPQEGGKADEGISEDFKRKCSVDFNGKVKEFEISLNDQMNALWELVNDTYSEADNTYYSIDAYESYVVMIDWFTGSAYKQAYKKDGDNFSLTGDRVVVHSRWLTAEEESALDEMKSNYSAIESELNAYKKAEEDAKKEEIFADKSYAEYLETEEFKTLMEDKDKYSVDELKDKAEIAFAKCVKKSGTFSMNASVESKKKHQMFSTKQKDVKKPYGNLFD